MAKKPAPRFTGYHVMKGLRDEYTPGEEWKHARDPVKVSNGKYAKPRTNSPFKRAKRSPVIVRKT